MILTSSTILFFSLLALLALALGHFGRFIPLYFFGVVILLFMGLFMLSNGVAEKIGENVTSCDFQEVYVYGDNYTDYHWDYMDEPPACSNPNDFSCVNLFHKNVSFNGCVEERVNLYDLNKNFWSEALGLLFVIIAAGLALLWRSEDKKRKDERKRSVELEE